MNYKIILVVGTSKFEESIDIGQVMQTQSLESGIILTELKHDLFLL